MASEAVVSVDLNGSLSKIASGKVRDLFVVDEQTLLFVASDRISAYDVVMQNVSRYLSRIMSCSGDTDVLQGIPGKGALLTAMRYNRISITTCDID